MSYGFEDGLKAAIGGVVSGIIISAIFQVLKSLGPEYASYIALFELVNLAGSIMAIAKLKYLASGYLIGFLAGLWLMSLSGLVESWLLLLYAIVGIPVIVGRFTRWAEDIFD